ncbi:MAG TPA: hypothetical protein VN282_24940 [Pyrinomonadaceae bacterium]|nr:hypothetical protein [Pyrinomonadaceae bacterium]
MTKKNIAAISILLLILLGAIYIGLGHIGLGNIGPDGRENALRLNERRAVGLKLGDASHATLLFALLHNHDADANQLAVSLDTLAPRLDLHNVLESGVRPDSLGVTLDSTNLAV